MLRGLETTINQCNRQKI